MAVEKEQLLAQLNTLREVQARFQQQKKAFEDVSQRFSSLEVHTRELEQAHIQLQADKRNLEAQSDSATKVNKMKRH